MKVRYLSGDQKGEVGYLGYHEAQAALLAKTIEVVNDPEEQANTGSEADQAEIKAGASAGDDFSDMTKDELLAEAERRKVEVKSSMTKAEIVEALRAAQ